MILGCDNDIVHVTEDSQLWKSIILLWSTFLELFQPEMLQKFLIFDKY
jgi:hypothetical protein